MTKSVNLVPVRKCGVKTTRESRQENKTKHVNVYIFLCTFSKSEMFCFCFAITLKRSTLTQPNESK